MRNLKEHKSYKTNPYDEPKQGYSATVFYPDEYTLNLILSLSARALRMLLVIAARVDPLTGISHCQTKELSTLFAGKLTSISRAKTELLRANLVAYGKANHSFYVNASAFRAIHVTF